MSDGNGGPGDIAGFHLADGSISLEDVHRALIANDQSWDAVFEAAGIGVMFGDMEGRVLKTNHTFLGMIGYSEEQFHRLGVQGITHPDDLELDLALFMEIIEGKRDRYQLDKRYVRKDGSVMWGRLTVMALRDSTGAPKLGLGTVQDITDIREAEELRARVRAAEQREHQALVLNDSIVQGLAVAKMALEMDDRDKAVDALVRTLERAKAIVSGLMSQFERRGHLRSTHDGGEQDPPAGV